MDTQPLHPHVLIKYFLSKPWGLICHYSSLHAFGKVLFLEPGCRDFPLFSHRIGAGWCWVVRPGSQTMLQFIPQVLDSVELQAQCKHVRRPFHFEMCFLHGGITMLKEVSTYFMPCNDFLHLLILVCLCVHFTSHRTEAPFFVFIIASGGSTPLKTVFKPLSRALRVPFVVVLKGQSTGHTVCVSQQSVDVCK